MEYKSFTLEPWGGNGPDKWDDGNFTGVREINITYYSNLIYSILVVYDKQGKPFKAERRGGDGYHTAEIKLNYPDEFLVGVSGHYFPLWEGSNTYIRSLKFTTNQRTFGPYGVEEGTPFKYTYPNLRIVGFHGTSDWVLYSIGVHVSHPLTIAEEMKTEDAWKGPERKYEALEKYGKDLTELAKAGQLDPVIGRDVEIRRCIHILSRRTKNNPVLIGEPGVGKTAISEGLAQRIVQGDVPDVLVNRRLIYLDVGALVAGSHDRGEFEKRLKDILNEIIESDGQTIVFIDEIHLIAGAGLKIKGAEVGMDASNLLKIMLGRGELRCIGATTADEYRKYIEKDAALERRFKHVYVDPPTLEHAISILWGLRERYEKHHGVRISDTALVKAAILSNRYITGRFLQEKAIDLVDEAAAKLKLEMTYKPTELDEIDRQILSLETEILSLELDKGTVSEDNLNGRKKELSDLKKRQTELTELWNYDKSIMKKIQILQKSIDGLTHEIKQAEHQCDLEYAVALKSQILEPVQKELEELYVNKRYEKSTSGDQVTENDIAEIVSKWSGIPISKLQQSETEKLLHLEEELRKHIVGQDHAVKVVAAAIRRSRIGFSNPHRPIASFMFMGPTGVGKTKLAKVLASYLFNTKAALVRFDMSEYKERHAVSRLMGAPPGYRDHDEGGKLTEIVRFRPYAVVLFDEIEKAHPDALDILFRILGDGRVTDSHGRTVSFTNTIIIMTSNVGSPHILNKDGNTVSKVLAYETIRQRVMDAAKSIFRPEFMNRVDEYVVFQPLDHDQVISIVSLQLERVNNRLADRNMKIEGTLAAIDLLGNLAYDQNFGAKPVKRVIQQNVENELADGIIRGEFKDGDTIFMDADLIAFPQEKLSFRRLWCSSIDL